MKKSLIILASILQNANISKSQTVDEIILGKWMSPDNKSILNFQKIGTKITATIFWLKQPNDINGKPILDRNNPDTKLKSRPLVGITVVYVLIKESNGNYKGLYYDVESGETYSCTITLDNTKMTMKVCDSSGFFCETELLTKIK